MIAYFWWPGLWFIPGLATFISSILTAILFTHTILLELEKVKFYIISISGQTKSLVEVSRWTEEKDSDLFTQGILVPITMNNWVTFGLCLYYFVIDGGLCFHKVYGLLGIIFKHGNLLMVFIAVLWQLMFSYISISSESFMDIAYAHTLKR